VKRPTGGNRPGRRLGRVGLAAALAGLWLVAAGTPAGAHALLRESDPASGSTLEQPPPQVVLTFTERPEPGLSSIRVLDTGGQPVEQGEAAPVSGQPLQFAVGLGDLADGTYTVSWRVVSKDDGHVTAGSFAFGVGVAAPAATPETQVAPEGAAESPSPAATASRLALYAGLVLLVGVAFTGLAVSERVLPPGARPLLAVAALLTLAGGVGRFLAELARIDAPLGTLLASSTGQGLVRLTTGVLVAVVATWFLATALPRPAPADGGDPAAAAAGPAPADGGLASGGGGGLTRTDSSAGPEPGPARNPALASDTAPTPETALAVAGPPEGEPSGRPDGAPPDVHTPSDPGAATAVEAGAVERWRLWLVGVAAGVTMLLHVLIGHAAGPSSLRGVNLLVQWLHVLGVGAWVGGLVWLLAALRARERPGRMAMIGRFSKLAAPVLFLVAVTGLSRTLHLAGGWQGLLDSSYGRLLDLKVLLFAGLVALGALNRYRILPALAAGVRRLDVLRRSVRGEIVLAACVLAVTAVFSQLPPGKFVVERASARPPAPPSVHVEGSDFATSVRVALTVAPGTPGQNSFTAKVTDYDSGQDLPATRVALRFTPSGRADVGVSTLELERAPDGLWKAQGAPLSIAGKWEVVGLIEGAGPAVTVPLELEVRAAPQPVKVSRAPGQPTLYTVTLAGGGTLQGYIDPGRLGPNTVHFTFFNQGGDEQPVTEPRARMTKGSGPPEELPLVRLGPGHFAANIDLEPGRVAFVIDATAGRTKRSGRFEQLIEQ
jgi:putative copper export protein/methionine-rich copper-binding protein CopC